MKRGNRPELIWGLGLPKREEEDLINALEPGFRLRNWPKDKLPKARDLEKDQPFLVFIPWDVWSGLSKAGLNLVNKIDSSQRVLLIEADARQVEFEEVLANGFLTALHTPLSGTKVQDTMFRAREVQGLYDDIFRMTQEIILERELLTRKTDQLMFLNKVLTRASETLDVATILACAREDLNMLFPVSDIFGVFWHQPDRDIAPLELELFTRQDMPQAVHEAWVEYLIESAARVTGRPVSSYQVTGLKDSGPPRDRDDRMPRTGRVVLLPLKAGQERFGFLVLLSPDNLSLAKDQIETMRAAVSHLSLALRNAIAFRKIKIRADHDGLTRIFNRQAFEERLVDELRRYQRYRHEVSLLLMDLDHFKKINDTYGHQAGDAVLRDIARILMDTLRSTDFVARYGGEEFVVILPHTTEEQAWMLAERLRSKIARKSFEDQGRLFRLTTSIGVASLKPGALSAEPDLLRLADQALYLAKASGRNMVCLSCGGEEARAVEN